MGQESKCDKQKLQKYIEIGTHIHNFRASKLVTRKNYKTTTSSACIYNNYFLQVNKWDKQKLQNCNEIGASKFLWASKKRKQKNIQSFGDWHACPEKIFGSY